MNKKIYKWMILDDIQLGYISIFLRIHELPLKSDLKVKTLLGIDLLSKDLKEIQLDCSYEFTNN